MKKILGGGVVLAAALLTAGCLSSSDDDPAAPAPQPEPRPLALTILHVNDHHSHLDAASATLQLKAADGTRKAVDVSAGGFPRLKSAIDTLAARSPNVLKLHAGDAMTGTLYFNRAGKMGEPDAVMMNTVCFDAFALGNHEFDKGDGGLKDFIDLLHAGDCKTPVLSANVSFAETSALNPSRAPGAVSPSHVVERDGQKIGIIGLTIAAKTQASSSPDKGTVFEDEAVAAQREIDRLRAEGIDKFILLSHTGYGYDQQIVAKLDGVDVVVGGDSHTLLGPQSMSDTYGLSGTPAGSYPTRLTDKNGKPVCVVQAWEYSQVVGELQVEFDAQGEVTKCEGTPHVLIGDDFSVDGAAVAGADRTAILADVQASGFLKVVAEDPEARKLLEPFKKQVDVFNQTVVAHAPEELCSRRVPGGSPTQTAGWNDYGRSSAACNELGDVTRRGGDIQQIVAQAFLEIAQRSYGGADLTLQSGGGVRVPLQGDITAGRAIEVVPFGNQLYRLEVTAAEIKNMLEDGMEATYGGSGATGPYPYTGGLRWDVDATRPKGQRVSNIELRDSATGNWNLLDLGNATRTYKLFVLSFNANGGDGYATLAAVPAGRRLDVGVLDADVFLEYIAAQPEGSNGLPELRKLDPALYSTKSHRDAWTAVTR
ncbi:MAG: 5'-nucleotidase C-terminal domain-containing protein [Pigmentiphaga sp.]|uniref:bifunctional metallophosphatase/5'-nucleotidase n=1 Tax=Pigmentiphaga sp. TaxID=1977564 RepID=UPI0029A89F93|nr:5'-nucleotidase C-terminal domain-containing protein [Pigmentiphaga sp.]MDX3907837.1 5'-nucleotidase C-terminal domain-containing protein [Pigmentiphaga sp.]